jgi:hypothetical protein
MMRAWQSIRVGSILAALIAQACQPDGNQRAELLKARDAGIIVELPAGPPRDPINYNSIGSEDAHRDYFCAGVLDRAMAGNPPEPRLLALASGYNASAAAGEAKLANEGLSREDSLGVARHWQDRGRRGQAPLGFDLDADKCLSRLARQ